MTEINLPFSPFAKKYLSHTFGEKWLVKNDQPLGISLMMGLRMLKPGEKLYRGAHLYTVIFPQYLTDRLGKVYISPQSLLEFEKLIILQFREEMFREIDKAIIGGEKIKDAICSFRDKFDIDEHDKPLSTLFKQYQRHYYQGSRSDNKHFREKIAKIVRKKHSLSTHLAA